MKIILYASIFIASFFLSSTFTLFLRNFLFVIPYTRMLEQEGAFQSHAIANQLILVETLSSTFTFMFYVVFWILLLIFGALPLYIVALLALLVNFALTKYQLYTTIDNAKLYYKKHYVCIDYDIYVQFITKTFINNPNL